MHVLLLFLVCFLDPEWNLLISDGFSEGHSGGPC